jgi:hypothetical protein
MKLASGRDKDRADVAALTRVGSQATEEDAPGRRTKFPPT